MITDLHKQRVEAKINDCITIIEKKYKVAFKKPTISYDLRGPTAGTANYRTWHIRLNTVLLTENVDTFIQRTVPHEVAHLATELLYPNAHNRGVRAKRSLHGHEWQSIMMTLGANASRCHSYDTTNSRVKKSTSYEYHCPRCMAKFSLGPKRHSKQQNGGTYYHPGCGPMAGKLVMSMTGVIHPTPVSKPRTIVPTVPNTKFPTGETKLAKCYRMFENYPGYSRAEMINVFVQEAGCTVAGAATYYATCKKLYG